MPKGEMYKHRKETIPALSGLLFTFIRKKACYLFPMCLTNKDVGVMAYLSVDNGCHPEAFARPGDRQHGPKEYKDGKHKGNHGGRDHVIKDNHKITHHF